MNTLAGCKENILWDHLPPKLTGKNLVLYIYLFKYLNVDMTLCACLYSDDEVIGPY